MSSVLKVNWRQACSSDLVREIILVLLKVALNVLQQSGLCIAGVLILEALSVASKILSSAKREQITRARILTEYLD